ncbi:5-methylthioadenosine/S-adenosylhomocysteine deaminase [bacterium BMS3Abin08]|nr:5-methylthioadenosine/S-adenosylhomocysteine deaminase [bacterium BMS3Abin08]
MTKERADLIIKGEYILTMTGGESLIINGALAVRDKRILAVGREEEINSAYTADDTIGGKGKAVMPGFVNTHTHAAMVYFRGMADDLPLKVWLEEYIWPAEAKWLGEEFVGDATELACLEMIKAGITLYNDMYFFEDASAEAVGRAGMRAVLASGILDFPSAAAGTRKEYLERAEEFILRWRDDDLITPAIAPHAPYTCSPDTYAMALEMARKYDTPVHTHLCETEWEVEEIRKRYGRTPIEHLDAHGLLSGRMLAAHVVCPAEGEIEILAERGVSVSHCLESNLKLASGIAPVVRMLNSGVNVTFGTDGAASNNDLDIMSEMSTAAKLHKAVSGDPTALSARTALMMATRWGAEALGLGDRVGSIQAGKLADLIVIDINKPHLIPIYDIYSHLVYSARSSDVEDVIINGKLVLNGRKTTTLSAEAVFSKARQWKDRIISP